MSASYLCGLYPGETREHIIAREFRNSWGTAPIVWDEFCVRWLGKASTFWLLNGSKPEEKAFWALWADERIPKEHRAAFLFTLDHIYVKKADYRRFAHDLRAFLNATKISANHVNHWPLIAQFFEMEPEYPAVGFWATSVCEDPWQRPYDEEKDEYGLFDWSKACDLYAELDGSAPETHANQTERSAGERLRD